MALASVFVIMSVCLSSHNYTGTCVWVHIGANLQIQNRLKFHIIKTSDNTCFSVHCLSDNDKDTALMKLS